MTTTRVYVEWTVSGVDHRPALNVLTSVAGDFAEDYDLEAAEDAYLARINQGMLPGFHMARNGQLFGPVDTTWLRENFEDPDNIDFLGGIEDIDVGAILEQHERRPKTPFERARLDLMSAADELVPIVNDEFARLLRAFRTLVERGSNPDAAVAVALTLAEHARTPLERIVAEHFEYAAERFPYTRPEFSGAAMELDSVRSHLSEVTFALLDAAAEKG